MNTATKPSTDLDFYPCGDPDSLHVCQQSLPNASGMSIATLGPRGEFISSRHLTQDELAVAWAEHNARHGRQNVGAK